jgi:hypothetical protein
MQQNQVNPDVLVQQTIQARLNVYGAREAFETTLKIYNDHVDALFSCIGLLKVRVLEQEAQIKGTKKTELVAEPMAQ